jgi:hypothetical protein
LAKVMETVKARGTATPAGPVVSRLFGLKSL